MKQFNFDSVTRECFSSAQMAQIRGVTIGIAGAGGLGSNCAMHLARCGFERFVIADFDTVEPSNLNRQFFFHHQIGRPKVAALHENLLLINPDLRIGAIQIRLDARNISTVFEDCNAVIEAFDKPDCKAMIAESLMGKTKLLVSASGLGGIGNSDAIVTRKINDGFYIVGDGVSGVGENMKPYAPRVAIAAAKQADVVLDWVLNTLN